MEYTQQISMGGRVDIPHQQNKEIQPQHINETQQVHTYQTPKNVGIVNSENWKETKFEKKKQNYPEKKQKTEHDKDYERKKDPSEWDRTYSYASNRDRGYEKSYKNWYGQNQSASWEPPEHPPDAGYHESRVYEHARNYDQEHRQDHPYWQEEEYGRGNPHPPPEHGFRARDGFDWPKSSSTSTSNWQKPPPSNWRGPPPSNRRGPPPSDLRGSSPSNWQKPPPSSDWQGPPPSDRRGPPPSDRQGLPSSDHRGPPPSDHRGPPPFDRQGPPLSDHRGPPPFDHRGPPPSDRRGPPPSDHRGPPSSDHRGPPPSDHRGPPSDHRGPPPSDHRGPPPSDHRGPPPFNHRGPPPSDHRGPPPSDHRGPPPSDHRGPPPSDRRGPPPSDRRGPTSSNWDRPPSSDRRGPTSSNWDRPPSSDRRGPISSKWDRPPSSDHRGPPSDWRGPAGSDYRRPVDPDHRGSSNPKRWVQSGAERQETSVPSRQNPRKFVPPAINSSSTARSTSSTIPLTTIPIISTQSTLPDVEFVFDKNLDFGVHESQLEKEISKNLDNTITMSSRSLEGFENPQEGVLYVLCIRVFELNLAGMFSKFANYKSRSILLLIKRQSQDEPNMRYQKPYAMGLVFRLSYSGSSGLHPTSLKELKEVAQAIKYLLPRAHIAPSQCESIICREPLEPFANFCAKCGAKVGSTLPAEIEEEAMCGRYQYRCPNCSYRQGTGAMANIWRVACDCCELLQQFRFESDTQPEDTAALARAEEKKIKKSLLKWKWFIKQSKRFAAKSTKTTETIQANSIKITNLPLDCRESRLKQIIQACFVKFGRLRSVSVYRSLTCAYVTFAKNMSVLQVMALQDRKSILKKHLAMCKLEKVQAGTEIHVEDGDGDVLRSCLQIVDITQRAIDILLQPKFGGGLLLSTLLSKVKVRTQEDRTKGNDGVIGSGKYLQDKFRKKGLTGYVAMYPFSELFELRCIKKKQFVGLNKKLDQLKRKARLDALSTCIHKYLLEQLKMPRTTISSGSDLSDSDSDVIDLTDD